MDSLNHIYRLMARVLADEASKDEREALQQILLDNPTLQQRFDILLQIINGKHLSLPLQADKHTLQKVEAILLKANRQTIKAKGKRSQYLKLAIAIFVMVAGAAWLFLIKTAPSPYIYIVAENGERKEIKLPDGTHIWLNGGSSIQYASNFQKDQFREIFLIGEAYFDVEKDISRPFIVHAGKVNIHVLGTIFNVRAYEEEHVLTTTLYRGAINITAADSTIKGFSPVNLSSNHKLTIPKDLLLPASQQVDSLYTVAPRIEVIDSTLADQRKTETAWVYNRLAFENEDFETLANRLEHWFNVKINFSSDAVKAYRFTGSFQNETIEQVLKALEMANPFHYSIRNNEIVINSS